MSNVVTEPRPRGSARVKVFQPIELRHAHRTLRAHLLDLSADGALLHASQPPPCGASVVVVLGAVEHGARVRWASGARFGVAFGFAMREDEIARVVRAAAPTCVPSR